MSSVWKLLQKLAALAVLLGLVFGGKVFAHPAPGPVAALLALGVFLLAGELAADLVERIGLPHLSGYLLAGLCVGPQVLNVVPHEAVAALQPVNALALALIALSAGAELTWPLLTKGFKSLSLSVLAQLLIVLPASIGALMLLRPWVPFLAPLPLKAALGITLLWGVIAVSRSPSATLGVLSQLHPDGPLTQQTLRIVVAFDLVVLVLFAISRNVTTVLTEPGASFTLSAMRELGVGMLGSVACGTTLGLLIAVYLRLIGRELILFLIVVGYGATEFTAYFHFEAMLLFIIAGFVVANISKQGERLLDAVAAGGRVVYVIFFALAGAHIDLRLLATIWPVALALVGVRIVTTFFSSRLGSRWAKDEEVVARYGWLPLISQAGVTIGMAVSLSADFPGFGEGLGMLAVAVVGLNEAIGPVLFKWALDKTGETGKGLHGADAAPGAPAAHGAAAEESPA